MQDCFWSEVHRRGLGLDVQCGREWADDVFDVRCAWDAEVPLRDDPSRR